MVHGTLAFFSGVAPLELTGTIGTDMSVEEGYAAARTVGLMMLRRIVDAFGTLDAVERFLKVTGYVRSAPGFSSQPEVVNGFSDLIIEVYGEDRGRCAAHRDRYVGAAPQHPHRGGVDRRVARRARRWLSTHSVLHAVGRP